MAQKKQTAAEVAGPMARVMVKRAISVGGIRYAPTVDGSKVTPIEATIPLERAKAHGEDDVEIIEVLGAEPDAGAGQK